MNRELRGIEVVAIGEELLSGATVDSNTARIAKALAPTGLRVLRSSAVGDSHDAIREAVSAALGRTGAVITSGGLGPTRDDVTKRAVAAVFGLALEFRDEIWATLLERWRPIGVPPASNRSQAEVPEGATTFPNPRGTAPGIAIEGSSGLCILLPGVPGELEAILSGSVIDFLAAWVSAEAPKPFRLELRTAGIAESAIAERVGDGLADLPLDVAFLPQIAGVDIRLTNWAPHEAAARAQLGEGEKRLREWLGDHIYGENEVDLATVVSELLRERNLNLVVAESCTGGLLASRLVDRAGASDFFWGGIVAYDDDAKLELLNVPKQTLVRHGAVSEQTAAAMAEGAQRISGAACAVSITGIAGPGGGTDEKPVGTVWIGLRVGDRALTKGRHYVGTRDLIRARAAQGALDLIRRTVTEQAR